MGKCKKVRWLEIIIFRIGIWLMERWKNGGALEALRTLARQTYWLKWQTDMGADGVESWSAKNGVLG